MYLNGLLFLIFVACFAGLFNNGLWSNTLTLINVITSALLATHYFEPLAGWLDKQAPSGGYIWDFAAIWLIFAISMMVVRAATDFASRVKVRFFPPVDQVGSYLFACWIAWVLVCFERSFKRERWPIPSRLLDLYSVKTQALPITVDVWPTPGILR